MATEKLALPKTKFSHELTAAAIDATMKAANATTAKLFLVPVGEIKPIPGFNVRVQSPDYIAHRDNIRAMIVANGFDSTKPLAGYVAKEGDKSVIYVTDGHTRLDAVNEFNADPDTAEKDEIEALPILIHPKAVSLTDLTVALHTANSGRPLTPYELGVVVKRLLAEEGAKKADIAVRLGVTTRYLDDVLLLANADAKVKQHVASGAVSSTMAIQLLRKDSETAGEKIEAAVAKSGGGKVTKKNVGPKMQKVKLAVSFDLGQDMKEIVKAVAAAVRTTVAASEGEDDTKLAAVAGTINLVIEVPAPEKAPAPVKAKAKGKATAKPAKAAKVKAEPEAPAEKPAKAKKAAAAEPEAPAKKAKGKGKTVKTEVVGEDDEIAKLPPKVKSDENVPDDEVDI